MFLGDDLTCLEPAAVPGQVDVWEQKTVPRVLPNAQQVVMPSVTWLVVNTKLHGLMMHENVTFQPQEAL